MNIKLKIDDVRNQILDYEKWTKEGGSSPLYEFFQFGQYPRSFSTPGVLRDCFLYDLFITHNTQNWTSSLPGPPHPGIFEDFFITIMNRLVGTDNALTLFVKDIDNGHFDEMDVIETLLAPKNLNYVLLGNPIVPGDARTQIDKGNLIFEWPLESLPYVVENWFVSPQVTIEGYISRISPLANIAQLYYQTDSEQRIRELLRTVELSFKIWRDYNGLFVLSDKLDFDALKIRLQLSDLNSMLGNTAREYMS